MKIELFFDLFLEELELNEELTQYYKFHSNERRFEFRKAYFVQRLKYIVNHLPKDKNIKILDLGCGFGTTAIFLAINGYKIEGITLEYYFKTLKKRMEYWSQFGNVSGFTFFYRDLFEGIDKGAYDVIIAQDTLHHLEPINDAVKTIRKGLKPKGILIAVEENGSNWIQNVKLIKQRGFKKVKKIYDEVLKKEILVGDENIRSLENWKQILTKEYFCVDDSSVRYIRFFFPSRYKSKSIEEIVSKEQEIQSKHKLLKKCFFFGLNFVASKK